MVKENKQPLFESVRKWHEAVLRHSMHVEFYIGKKSSVAVFPSNTCSEMYLERPHDVAGDYSKLEPSVIYGLALQFEEGGFLKYKDQIMSAVELHRNQLHHQIFNDPIKLAAHESRYDKFLCGLDAVCSLLESDAREYQGRAHGIENIKGVIAKNPEHKRPWMNLALGHVSEVGTMCLEGITLDSPVNIGLSERVCSDIVDRVQSSLETMEWVYAKLGEK